MSKLIILTGDIATGKTSFSKILAEQYNIEVYNKDTIKEVLADDISFSNREENLRLSKAAVDIMTLIFEQHLATDTDLILEANFHKDELDRIYALARAKGVSVLTLVLEADLDILYERFQHRVEFEDRHPAHQSAGLTSFEAFEEYVLKAREGLEFQGALKINANNFSYQENDVLLSTIYVFMNN